MSDSWSALSRPMATLREFIFTEEISNSSVLMTLRIGSPKKNLRILGFVLEFTGFEFVP